MTASATKILAPLVLLLVASAAIGVGQESEDERSMRVQYLEIVTPDVEETCESLAEIHDVEFSEPVAELGMARTAAMPDGGLLGVRAPMRDDEDPVVRPYLLVEDIEAAVASAEAAGAEIAIPPMELPGGRGTFAIYLHGGIQYGLWKL